MLRDVFVSGELVRVIDFLLDEPGRELNKSEIAEGAGISRPTLYKVWERLAVLGLVQPARKEAGVETYRLNSGSALVRSLLKFDNELAKTMSASGVDSKEELEEAISSEVEELSVRTNAWAALLGVVPKVLDEPCLPGLAAWVSNEPQRPPKVRGLLLGSLPA